MFMRDEYDFLSNMYPCKIIYEFNNKPRTFDSSEALFQAFKCPARAAEFTGINGYVAKRLGRRVDLRPDWEAAKIQCMAEALAAKFSQNPALYKKLQTVTEPIVEDNTWNDTFWGKCNGRGKNWLGRLLEQVKIYAPDQPDAVKTWLENLEVKTCPKI